MDEELKALQAFLEWMIEQQVALEEIWIGRCVKLREPFGRLQSVNGDQHILPAGAVGYIVQLRMDPQTPLVVEFRGFPHRVAPLIDKLELAIPPGE